ncbi:hypothetical protein BFP72_09200 [Reichenbachiella sp. 5M10]|uniref:NUDIX domain-containing protein n=1 Tax=Reichenbachiella sp. 5M10 TaxID=1889772 RepID=UPI000C159941|nr:NUDIX domain-containing protein [Reichenbachiella sp. 5M10]PIB35554.1 hypothetical protein BFP72_09200 [Reichenbachiella sp. 5M10]
MTSEEIASIFGNKVRVRVMGLWVHDHKVLLLNHSGLNTENELWLPPGGGVEFGEGLSEALSREFREELRVEVTVGDFLFLHEFRSEALHAIELFFEIKAVSGEFVLGIDPESGDNQSLQEYAFLSIDDIQKKGEECFHPVLRNLQNMNELLGYRGFFIFGK